MNCKHYPSLSGLIRGSLTLALGAALFSTNVGTAEAAIPGSSAGASIKNVVKVEYFDASGKGLNGGAGAIVKSAWSEVTVTLLQATPSIGASSPAPVATVVSGAIQTYDFKVWSNANGKDVYIFDIAAATSTDTTSSGRSITAITDAQGNAAAGAVMNTATNWDLPIGAVTIISNTATTVTIPFGTMAVNDIHDGDLIMINNVEYRVVTTTVPGSASAYDGGGNLLTAEVPTTISITLPGGGAATLPASTGLTLSEVYTVTVSVTATADPTKPKGTDCFTGSLTSKTDGTKTTSLPVAEVCADFTSSNLEIEKIADTATAQPNEVITYTVTVKLESTAANATSVKVIDAVPVYTTLVDTAYGAASFAQVQVCDYDGLTNCSAFAPITGAVDDENANVAAGSRAGTAANQALTFVLGTGQDGSAQTGGTVVPNKLYRINYQVTVN